MFDTGVHMSRTALSQSESSIFSPCMLLVYELLNIYISYAGLQYRF